MVYISTINKIFENTTNLLIVFCLCSKYNFDKNFYFLTILFVLENSDSSLIDILLFSKRQFAIFIFKNVF